MGSCALTGSRIMHLSVCWGCVGVSTETWWPSAPESCRMVILLSPFSVGYHGKRCLCQGPRSRRRGHLDESPGPVAERGSPAPLADEVGVEAVGEEAEGQPRGRVGPGELPAGPAVAEGSRRARAAEPATNGQPVVAGDDESERAVRRAAHGRLGQRDPDV